MRKLLLTISMVVTLYALSYGQTGIIEGSVIAQDSGFPLESASVRSIRTGTSTMTNAKGLFSLSGLPESDTLQISYMGYITQHIALRDARRSTTIQLIKDYGYLEEVVVSTGYQTLPRERATGSFEAIPVERLQNIASVNILENLEGNSSIMFDKSGTRPAHTIRGLSSINGNNAPLIVLDNFPFEGDINFINPSDIANITILKDAAASSIWGTRAGNGVIVITTKKGGFGKPVRLSFNSLVQMGEIPDLFAIDQISASDVIDLESYLFDQGYYRNLESSTSRPYLSPVVEMRIAQREGMLAEAEVDERLNRLRSLDYRQDFLDHMYEKSINQQYGLSIEGGSQQMTYLFSARLDNNSDNLHARYKKINLRSFNEFKFSERLSAAVGITYSNARTLNGKTGYMPGPARPYYQLLDENGDAVGRADYRQAYIDTTGDGLLLDWNNYPYSDYEHVRDETGMNSLITDFSGKIGIIEGLDMDLIYRYENQMSDRRTLNEQDSYFTRNLINSFSTINSATGAIRYGIPLGSILQENMTEQRTHNGRINLNLDREWGDHRVAAIAGAEIRDAVSSGSSGRIYGFDADIYTVSSVDFLNPYPHYVTGRNQYVPYNTARSLLNNRFVSQFANGSYAYKGRYILSASARRDASNLFGVKTNEKWQPLWSVGARWKLSAEEFFVFDKVTSLDLRLTYGISGNVDQRKSAVTTLGYSSPDFMTNFPIASISQYRNPELRWERNKIFNAGIDFALTDQILSGSVEFFSKKGDDLFGTAPVDYTAVPTKNLLRNVANMEGHGIELNLSSRIRAGEFIWQPQLFFSYGKSRVTKNHLSSDQSINSISNGTTISAMEGHPVYSVIAFSWAGLSSEGDPQGYVDGVPSIDYTAIRNLDKEHLVFAGSAIPIYSGYFNHNFSFRGFSAMVNISYKLGHAFFRESVDYAQLMVMNSLGNGTGDYARRWQNPGDELNTSVPRFIYPSVAYRDEFYTKSEVLVESGSNIRLQNVVVSYQLREIGLGAGKVNSQVYLNASNLGIIWRANKRGIDPDFHRHRWPTPMTVALGIRMNIN